MTRPTPVASAPGRSPNPRSTRAQLARQLGRLLRARIRRLQAARRRGDLDATLQAVGDVADLADLLVTLVGGDRR